MIHIATASVANRDEDGGIPGAKRIRLTDDHVDGNGDNPPVEDMRGKKLYRYRI